jgi:AcrR family transcriptional regulator
MFFDRMLTMRAPSGIRENTMFHALVYGRHDAPPMKMSPSQPSTPADAKPSKKLPAGAAIARKVRSPQKSADAPEHGRQSLTPEAWIDAATEVLVDRGIDHVRVDVLASQLGVTRGSFYWHFRDREDLLRRVLEAWRNRATVRLTRRLSLASQDARAQLRDVISLPHRGRSAARAARIELAIRAWARRDQMARAAVDEADQQRIAYHGQIFESLGFEPDEAALRAFVMYSYEVAESLLHQQGQTQDRQRRQAFLEVLMTTPLRPAAPG